jgi:hypothetical protein
MTVRSLLEVLRVASSTLIVVVSVHEDLVLQRLLWLLRALEDVAVLTQTNTLVLRKMLNLQMIFEEVRGLELLSALGALVLRRTLLLSLSEKRDLIPYSLQLVLVKRARIPELHRVFLVHGEDLMVNSIEDMRRMCEGAVIVKLGGLSPGH